MELLEYVGYVNCIEYDINVWQFLCELKLEVQNFPPKHPGL